MKISTSGLLFVACLLTAVTQCTADVLDSWYWRNPAPFANSLRSVCFGAGKFVAVGDGGVIHTSRDGISWDAGRRPVLSALFKVIFASGAFVAVGHDGVIVTSADGYSWETRSSGTTNALYAVAYGNGKYVACGEAGRMSASPDGSTWTPGSVGTNDLNWIAFGNDVFVLPTPDQQMAVRVSDDAETWATATFPNSASHSWPPNALFQVEFGDGIFVAIVQDEVNGPPFGWQKSSHFYYAADGSNWTQGSRVTGGPGGTSSGGFWHRFLRHANGSFYELTARHYFELLEEDNPISVSVHGTTSTTHRAPADAYDAADLAYANGRYVLAGLNGKVWTSANTTNWATGFSSFHSDFHQVIHTGNGYLALAGSSPVLTSLDGLNFTPVANSPTGLLSVVAFDGSNYVAVGGIVFDDRIPPTATPALYTSSNSLDWIPRTSNAGDNALRAICRGQARWVAVGDSGTIITSPNGLAWTLRTSGTANRLNGVAFGNDVYVAVGSSGTIMSSPDGAVWDAQFSGTTANLNRVRFLNGQFFAVGANGTILTSADGNVWTDVSPDTTRTLTDVSYGDGRYVACGFDRVILNLPDPMSPNYLYWPSINLALESTDGSEWKNISTKVPTHVGLTSVAFLNGSFWLCGQNGALLQSDSVDGIPRISGTMLPGNAGFQLRVSLNVPSTFRVQASTSPDPESWQDIASVTNSGLPVVWTDTETFGTPIRLYRIVSP